MSDGPEWFAPKRYGYGAGLPISWQGWALTIGLAAYAVLVGLAIGNRLEVTLAAIALPLIGYLVIASRTTRGGWRWRWGDED
jgi:hypothetical protein